MVVVAAIKCTTKAGQSWAKMAETHQKLDQKIWEIDVSYLCLQGFDKFEYNEEFIELFIPFL